MQRNAPLKKIFFFSIILYSSGQILLARTIDLTLRLKQFTIKEDINSLLFKDNQSEILFTQKKCNEHIIKSLQNELNIFLKVPFPIAPESEQTYKIKIDEKQNIDWVNSKRGEYFSHFYERIKQAKAEEFLHCQKFR